MNAKKTIKNAKHGKELATKKNDAKQPASKSKEKSVRFNSFLWLVVVALAIAGFALNSYYSQVAGALRAAGGIVLFIVVLSIAAATSQGQKAWVFIKGARTELRKVVWPTRQETIQTTLVVIAMVLVMALILWGLDSLFLWAVSWLTGQRG